MFVQNKIEKLLKDNLNVSNLLIRNDSYKHNVPPNSESHFNVQIVSDDFEDLSQIQRHKIVYKAVGALLAEIHAFSITAMTTSEFKENPSLKDTPDCEN
ncbi:MAG: BolA family protein [Gammaproteobacteria bacterium]|jgi:BolA protein|tara:strand:- start:225 stop:521 length:297 start_codon:yes stop_codon:yes gene_type:complete